MSKQISTTHCINTTATARLPMPAGACAVTGAGRPNGWGSRVVHTTLASFQHYWLGFASTCTVWGAMMFDRSRQSRSHFAFGSRFALSRIERDPFGSFSTSGSHV